MHMINTSEILETLNMIDHQKLDVRTITMGISLLSCVTDDEDRLCGNIYDLITRRAERLVQVGREIERDYGVPIVNKRISVTPAALVTGAIKHPVPLIHLFLGNQQYHQVYGYFLILLVYHE